MRENRSSGRRRLKLQGASGRPFYNTSRLDFARLLDDPNNIAQNLSRYIRDFSDNVFEVMQRFGFDEHITRMNERNLLYQVIQQFANVDLSPERVDNVQMGYYPIPRRARRQRRRGRRRSSCPGSRGRTWAAL